MLFNSFTTYQSRIEKKPITSKCRMNIHPERLAAVSNSNSRQIKLEHLEYIGCSNSHFFNQFFRFVLLIRDSLNEKQAFHFVGR